MGDRKCSPVGDRTEPNNPPTAHGWTAYVIDNCGQPALVFDHATGARIGSMWALDERQKDAAEADLVRCIEDAALLAELREKFHEVAHAAWHLMDDSGEAGSSDDNGAPEYLHAQIDHEKLSAALDALEAIGWNAHPEDGTDGVG